VAKVTVKDLVSSGILKYFIDHLKQNIKDKKARSYFLNLYLNNIIHNFYFLRKICRFQDPAKDYLKKLQKDYNALRRLKTHKPDIEAFKDLIGYEIAISKRYSDLFRSKKNQNYSKDLLFLSLYDLLKDLKYKKRIEIISDIYLFFFNPPEKCDDWKSKHPDYFWKEFYNIKKRLQRTRGRFALELKTKRYRDYERRRFEDISQIVNEAKSKGKEVRRIFNSRINIKKYIKMQYIKRQLENLAKEQERKYKTFNIFQLTPILKSLGIPRSQWIKITKLIVDDREFLNAFRSFSLKE